MSHTHGQNIESTTDSTDGRRRQLRDLLLNSADTARQMRRVRLIAARVSRPVGRAVRDRVSMLLSAAG